MIGSDTRDEVNEPFLFLGSDFWDRLAAECLPPQPLGSVEEKEAATNQDET